MKEHRYGVTVTYLETADGEKPEVEPISFEVLNHDDIFRIIGLMNESKILGAIGISVGNQATVMLVWGLILERIFTL